MNLKLSIFTSFVKYGSMVYANSFFVLSRHFLTIEDCSKVHMCIRSMPIG